MMPSPEVCEQIRARFVSLGLPDWNEADRDRLLKLLAEHDLSWSSLPEVFAAAGVNATAPLPDLLARYHFSWGDMPKVFSDASAPQSPKRLRPFRQLAQLFGLVGSVNINEATSARKKLDAFLVKHKLNWGEFTMILAARAAPAVAPKPAPASMQEPPRVNVLDLVLRVLEMYVVTTPAARMVSALYALFTHVVFKWFSIAPRLAVLSPVEVSGKTLLLKLLEQLVFRPYRTDNATAAAIYRQLYFGAEQTLLLDEGDNLGLFEDKTLRATLNSGYDYGGKVTRVIDGRPRTFLTFGPLVLAALGKLPLPLLSRCVATINMLRPTRDEARQLERFDLRNPGVVAIFHAAREQIERWAATCTLPLDPQIPSELHLRHVDNWRPLLAIADSLGRGEAARAAAVELCGSRQADNSTIRALTGIRTVLDETRKTDRILGVVLVEDLIALDDFWLNWRGPQDDRLPRKLTQNGLAELLSPFGIRTRTVWPVPRRADSKSGRGYYRSQFVDMWDRYCPPADTPTQSAQIIGLPPR
jgi:hypothetical protein